jgi:putative nucleotidyltransferase with HDIG domain
VIRVLAVDDEPAANKLMTLIFRPPDFNCTAVASAELALAALRVEPFDVVVSDLTMPGINGMELLSQVRRRYPQLPFLVTTGVDDVEVGVKAMRSGADDYLVKPLVESAVLASVEASLRKRFLEQELENYRQRLESMVDARTAQLQAALQTVECSYEDSLQALGTAIDLRDRETGGHSRRVCQYSLEIARTLNWSEPQMRSLARGAYLHDIGKLGIPDAILLKPGPLTAEERELMQQHVQIGFEIIMDIPFLSDAAEIILAHHERYDGTGYPQGLKAEKIVLGARIFAAADTLDAITSDRPYRKASTFSAARETIRLNSGSQFDPQVVAAFLAIPEERWPAIAKNLADSPKRSPIPLASVSCPPSISV